jgi:phosphoglycolate phosphatase-like HAD superfamily hydrolase
MTDRTPLILWDIDGTLLRSRGRRVTVNAFNRALKHTSKLAAELAYPKDAHGKTDNQIALEMLVASSFAEADAAMLLGEFGQAYLAALEAERETLVEDLEVLPGVVDVLNALKRQGVTQSLLTGNLEPVARLKLACAGLDQLVRFEIGAFGSDHHDRTCLVPIVRERVKQRLGYEPAPDEIVVVGDTPRDIACARAGGARAIAVATGHFTRQDLDAHAPDAILDDLHDTQAVLATLLRYSTDRPLNAALNEHRLGHDHCSGPALNEHRLGHEPRSGPALIV